MDKSAENNKPIENRKRFTKFLHIFIIVAAVIVLTIEGVLYYQRSYLTPFWVNGQSMYPTLNLHAKDALGHEIGSSGGGAAPNYTVDYGVMDTHKGAIKKIKRFDIVVTKYTKNDTSNKIKRVLALPGETIRFEVTGIGNEHNGDLYINDKLIEQPIEAQYIQNGSYPSTTWTLGSDEYFVCGDNRGHSSDSRQEGPIRKDYITGKVIAICGTAIVYQDGAYYDVKNIKYSWPRYL